VLTVLRRIAAMHSSPEFPQLPGLRPVATTYGASKRLENVALTSFANEQAYVFNVGEINTRILLQRLVEDQLDFAVPFDTSGLEVLPPFEARQTISADSMLRLLIDVFNPLIRGLRILRDLGLRSIFLHSVPPPAVNDVDSARVMRFNNPALLRYKLVMFVNYLYASVCRELGIGFVNTWPLVTRGNLLQPEFYLDGLHLNRDHSILSVNEVYRQFSALKETA
ncbi:MAG TPA: hypothetical protein VFN49_10440, partial [Candidatus Aquilonibacter sp.]|nr:hypothetical protein [Candidatus Aquilonibacter sp.]